MQPPAIHHDRAGHRFATTLDGNTAHLDYEREGGVIAITHTIVPSQIGGRGIAGQLVEAALAYAREEGLRVTPRCSYAEAYLRRHPQHAGMVAPA